jgi:hypothetical protein
MHANRTRPLHVVIGLSLIVLCFVATIVVARDLPIQWQPWALAPVTIVFFVTLAWLAGWRPGQPWRE